MNSIASRTPIFITVRGNSEEIVNKHKEALKFAYLFIKEQDLFEQTYIISDNKNDILNYAVELGFKHIIYYPCGCQKDLKYLEYMATYRFAVETNYHPDWILLLNINQLFLSQRLVADCIRNIDDKYDVVASYTEISNRSHFFVDESLNNKEKQNDKHLLSSEYDRVKMVDAAVYAVKTEFAFSCMDYADPSEHFWNGKIKYFKNTSVYTDIYTIDDIYKYYSVGEIIEKVKKLKDI